MKKFCPLLLLIVGLLLGAAATQVTHLDHRIVDLVGSQLKFDSQSSLTNEDGLWSISASGLQVLANPVWTNDAGTVRLASSNNASLVVVTTNSNPAFFVRQDTGRATMVGDGALTLKDETGFSEIDSYVYVDGGKRVGFIGMDIDGSSGDAVSLDPLSDNGTPCPFNFSTGYSNVLSATATLLAVANGHTNKFLVTGSGQIVLAGTTNQVTFGGTNTAPSSSVAPTKWISVQVSGESVVYRLPLYQ